MRYTELHNRWLRVCQHIETLSKYADPFTFEGNIFLEQLETAQKQKETIEAQIRDIKERVEKRLRA